MASRFELQSGGGVITLQSGGGSLLLQNGEPAGFFSPLLFIIGGLGAPTAAPSQLPPLTMPPMQALGWGSGNWGWR